MRRTTVRTAGTCLAVALVALGCRDRKETETVSFDTAISGVAAGDVAPTPAVPTTPTVTDVAAIVGNPRQFIGKTVTVEADVDEVLSPYAFELDEDSPVRGGVDNDLIVTWPKSLTLAPLDNKWRNNKVRVTGVVRVGSVTEIEREVDRDFSTEIEAEVKLNPVLVATSVERIKRP